MKKRIFLAGFAAVFIIALIIILFVFYSLNDDYVCRIGDIKIYPGEYKVYFYEQKKFFEETGGTDIWETDIDGASAEDVAKQQTINSIAAVKIALNQWEKLNITFSEAELNSIQSEADKFYNELGSDRIEKFEVTFDDIYNIIREGQIQKKVFDYITEGFIIKDEEINEYFNEYYEANKVDLTNIKVKYIFKGFNEDKSNFNEVYRQMEEIYAKVTAGENFDELINKYSESSQKGEITLKKDSFENTVKNEIYAIGEKNKTTGIITSDSGFYIVYISKFEKPDIKNLQSKVREEYIQRKKQEVYQKQSERWLEDFPIERNNEVFSKIGIEDIS